MHFDYFLAHANHGVFHANHVLFIFVTLLPSMSDEAWDKLEDPDARKWLRKWVPLRSILQEVPFLKKSRVQRSSRLGRPTGDTFSHRSWRGCSPPWRRKLTKSPRSSPHSPYHRRLQHFPLCSDSSFHQLSESKMMGPFMLNLPAVLVELINFHLESLLPSLTMQQGAGIVVSPTEDHRLMISRASRTSTSNVPTISGRR